MLLREVDYLSTDLIQDKDLEFRLFQDMRPSSICLGARRLGLTTKHGHNFYKGTRTGATGQHTKHGGYVVDWAKVRTYPRPTMMDACQVTAECAC